MTSRRLIFHLRNTPLLTILYIHANLLVLPSPVHEQCSLKTYKHELFLPNHSPAQIKHLLPVTNHSHLNSNIHLEKSKSTFYVISRTIRTAHSINLSFTASSCEVSLHGHRLLHITERASKPKILCNHFNSTGTQRENQTKTLSLNKTHKKGVFLYVLLNKDPITST